MSNLARVSTSKANHQGSDEAEFVLTGADIDTIESILRQESGVRLGVSRQNMVYSRLIKRLRSLGLESFKEYCKLLKDRRNVDERRHMIDALTTNHTRFFRESHHFDHMHAHSLPPLLEAAKKGKRVRIWCAGCSSGEEAYCLAITILSLMPNASSFDIKILATDINTTILEKAKNATYPARAVTDIPPEVKSRWFSSVSNGIEPSYRVKDEVGKLISFRNLNLLSDWPMAGPFQIIFCRNVTIYFDDEVKSKLWKRFAGLMPQQGTLYIGHSEHVSGPAEAVFKAIGTTTYERKSGAC